MYDGVIFMNGMYVGWLGMCVSLCCDILQWCLLHLPDCVVLCCWTFFFHSVDTLGTIYLETFYTNQLSDYAHEQMLKHFSNSAAFVS